jgi:mono/diheme cytochrome c family protein
MLRKIGKIFKWTGIIIVILVSLVTITVVMRQDLQFDAPLPEITASKDSAIIARGREIVIGPAHCASCHSTQNSDSLLNLGQEPIMSGGFAFKLPLGNFYTRNITPDEETGIGKLTDGEIARMMRYGVKSDGSAALDFMPFHNVSDEDLTAIISYLRAQKPVKNKVPENEYTIMGNVLKAFVIKPVGPSEEIVKKIERDSSANYGRYLALNVANCTGCHTQRGMTGNYIGQPFAGGSPMIEGGDTLIPPNLTPHPEGRIYTWSKQDFINRVRMGSLIKHSHMPWNSYKRMSDADLTAIYNYLKSLPPTKTGELLPEHSK